MIIEIKRTIDTNDYINDIVEKIICHYSNYWYMPQFNEEYDFNLHYKNLTFEKRWFTNYNVLSEISDMWEELLGGELDSSYLEKCMDWVLSNKDVITEAVNSYINSIENKYQELLNKKGKEKNDIITFYSVNYNPPKNSVCVIYNGKEYKSKKQCCILENITMTQLNNYLKSL